MKINKILIAVDDNKYAEHAAEVGFDMAQLFGADVGLVSIVAPLILPESSTDVITGLPMESMNIDEAELIKIQSESAENVIQQTIKKFAGDRKVTHFTEYGSTADGILKCSVEFNADLIVVGTHNRTGLNRLIMGSVSEHVVRHSHVPVLVVPLREES
ncbi:universal stress protein [Mucilaginibacter sp. McL0603]|uniref:universal stress protein n=1 Tax=Mucilaginibacter sp. McL0603 TaxID=3415670 RepID=UPI003CF06A93